jgi:hypothetical protein
MTVSCKQTPAGEDAIRAFNIDFNMGTGGRHGFAAPGQYADADPAAHVQWYADMGCNVIHSFAVSCNGYAWYKNGFVPEQPGLKHDFLKEEVQLARAHNMKVMAYFCIGANNKWEDDHPDLCYRADGMQIPLTRVYLDYLCASIEDAIRKTDVDGIMLDWFYNPGGGKGDRPPLRWIPCEEEMYRELMGEDFPGKENITKEQEVTFRQKAIGRAWKKIRTVAKGAKPDCIIWLTAFEIKSEEYENNALLKEVDWLMNEAGDRESTRAMHDLTGPNTRLITCLARWNRQNPLEIVPDAAEQNVGLYGFRTPDAGTILPPISGYLSASLDTLKGDDLNMAVLARYFNGLPINFPTGK